MKTCTKCGESKFETDFGKHSSGKNGLNPKCKACVNAHSKAWKEANPERNRKAIADWWRRNPEKKKTKDAKRADYFSQYRKDNAGRINAKSARHYAENRELRAEQDRHWRAENPDKTKAIHAKWRASNPDKVAARNHARRAAYGQSDGSHTPEELIQLLERQGYQCANPKCCVDLRVEKRHLDHKQPISRGGSNYIANLQWLCAFCNLSKGALDYEDWLQKVGIAHEEAA
ncbi:HNH endonuclease [Paraburkholderia phenazinium]|uniref:HNH endonuclease n=1 Tax=Paraburkholderia phenazinium TaxID=60549 RepID=A0A1G7ZL92_9BURK|nr:HNH endonuclease signature motif containing protein [Paraburkholderia phenazinium]SDH09512.1 HNH endonuclease [Paraburkholderia phenazinium]